MREKHQSFSGTILVAWESEDLIILSYGLADRENEVPNTSNTKYAIGSISKSFTAMAIMILEERGLLKVEDSLCKYLPDCPDAWEPVTLHHLLNHTSGIPSYTDLAAQGKIVFYGGRSLQMGPGTLFRSISFKGDLRQNLFFLSSNK
jgi:CubicO group peptidase (beta-lactamase class C family)